MSVCVLNLYKIVGISAEKIEKKDRENGVTEGWQAPLKSLSLPGPAIVIPWQLPSPVPRRATDTRLSTNKFKIENGEIFGCIKF